MSQILVIFNDSNIEILKNEDTMGILDFSDIKCDEKKCITKWTFSNLAIIKKFFSDSSGKLLNCYRWTFQGNNLCLEKYK